jgi:hypothetical protein
MLFKTSHRSSLLFLVRKINYFLGKLNVTDLVLPVNQPVLNSHWWACMATAIGLSASYFLGLYGC